MKHWEYTINSLWLLNLVVLAVGVFYAIPDKYLLDYRSIDITYECIDGEQILHAVSERYPKITLAGSGEDNIFIYPVSDGDLPVKRIEWSGATYRVGTTNDAWDIIIEGENLQQGTYLLRGEILVKLLFLTRALDPVDSNSFEVSTCQKKS